MFMILCCTYSLNIIVYYNSKRRGESLNDERDLKTKRLFCAERAFIALHMIIMIIIIIKLIVTKILCLSAKSGAGGELTPSSRMRARNYIIILYFIVASGPRGV